MEHLKSSILDLKDSAPYTKHHQASPTPYIPLPAPYTRLSGTPERLATRWITTLSANVNLPYAINCRAWCGANSVTFWNAQVERLRRLLEAMDNRDKSCTTRNSPLL